MSLNSLIFSGDEYDPADVARLQQEYRYVHPNDRKDLFLLQKNYREQKKKDTRNPTTIFFDLLNRSTTKAFLNYEMLEDKYVWQDKVLCVIEKWGIPKIENSKSFVVYLRRVYCVGSERGKGYGTGLITKLKQLAEITGCVLCLVASNYEISGSDDDKGGFHTTSMKEVIELDYKQHTHYLEFNQDYLNQFYKNLNFINGRIFSGLEGYEEYSLDQQFIFYRPSSLAPENLKEIEKILV